MIYPVFIGMGIATGELARQKGYKGRWWFLAGMLIPIISTLLLFMMKSRKLHTDIPVDKEPLPTHNDKILYQKTS